MKQSETLSRYWELSLSWKNRKHFVDPKYAATIAGDGRSWSICGVSSRMRWLNGFPWRVVRT
jgi:hypothetical protein